MSTLSRSCRNILLGAEFETGAINNKADPAPREVQVQSDGKDLRLVMPIGNKKFGIPRKYQYQIGIWYLCPDLLVFS